MLRQIRVYGKLAKYLGQRVFEAAVDSAAEAIRFLMANFPGLERHMMDQRYHVLVGDYDLGEDELIDPAGHQVIKIVPVITGASLWKIIAGIALITASIFIPGSALVFGTALKTIVATVGVSLTLTGVAGLLTPAPKLENDAAQDPRDSFNFSGIQNTSRAGVPVPIVYGDMITGSVVVSTSIDTVRVRG